MQAELEEKGIWDSWWNLAWINKDFLSSSAPGHKVPVLGHLLTEVVFFFGLASLIFLQVPCLPEGP